MFIYGLDEEKAQAKMMDILTKLRRTALVPPHGSVQDEVVFVKTPNTVTMISADPRRKIQVRT